MADEQYEIKQAGINDLDELAEVFDLYRIFYGQASNVKGAKVFLQERMNQKESVIFLVRDKDRDLTAGFAQLYPSFSSVSMRKTFILNDLYVREEYRKQGIARILLDQVKVYAEGEKAKRLSLSTAVSNLQAQRLYEQGGYVKDEVFYHYNLNLED